MALVLFNQVEWFSSYFYNQRSRKWNIQSRSVQCLVKGVLTKTWSWPAWTSLVGGEGKRNRSSLNISGLIPVCLHEAGPGHGCVLGPVNTPNIQSHRPVSPATLFKHLLKLALKNAMSTAENDPTGTSPCETIMKEREIGNEGRRRESERVWWRERGRKYI